MRKRQPDGGLVGVGGSPANTIRSIQFGPSTNAEVEVTDRPASGAAFALDMPPGATQASFTVHRTANGPVQTPFTVVDGCGEWRTFVGGGASAL